jgi:hypothetical protein
MARLNITETNFLAILRDRKRIPQRGVAPGGRYHVALMGLVRAGYARLKDGEYTPTDAGLKYLSTVQLTNGTDVRSRMKQKGQ